MRMYELETKIIEIIQRTKSVKSFRFAVDERVLFKPGQYVLVSIDVAGEKQTKPLSISNSPTEKGYIEVTKRITDSDYSKVLNGAKPGDTVFIKFPFGKFTFEGEHKKIALLSGGIGITPFRSICKFATEKKLNTDIFLFYGNNTLDDIVFHDELEDMEKNNTNLHITYTLSQVDVCPSDSFKKGYIDKCMIEKTMPDYSERTFYVCGPPGMVSSLTDILKKELGISEDQVIVEKFMGY